MSIEPEEKKKNAIKSLIINRFLKVVLPLALGIVIIYILVKDIDPSELWGVMKEANIPILLLSLVFGLLGNTIRGYRWELLIRPLGYKPRISTLNYAVYGSYAVNFVLPRAGEIWRCGVVAKDEDIPFAKTFGTMVLDRILDTLTVLFLTLLACGLNMQFFIKQLKQKDEIIDILQSPILYISIFLVVIFVYIIFRFFKSHKIVATISDFVRGMWNDLKTIWKMDTKGRLFIYTLGIWSSYFLYFYITFFAFDFTKDLGITVGLIAFVMGSLSMGVPSMGGLGPWHFAIIATLTLYGIDKVSATAFATGVFTIQSLWVILYGLFGMAALSLRKKRV